MLQDVNQKTEILNAKETRINELQEVQLEDQKKLDDAQAEYEKAMEKFKKEKAKQDEIIEKKTSERAEKEKEQLDLHYGLFIGLIVLYGFIMSFAVGYLKNAFKTDLELFDKIMEFFIELSGNELIGIVGALVIVMFLFFLMPIILKLLKADKISYIVLLYSFGVCMFFSISIVVWYVVNLILNIIFERNVKDSYGDTEKFYQSLINKV